jgi:hypothetical protein
MAYLVPPFIFEETPAWEPDNVPAFTEGLRLRAAARARRRRSPSAAQPAPLESLGETMNAFASVIIPADPDVPGDKAAGELGEAGGRGPFFRQMLRFIRLGFVVDLGVDTDEDDARAAFGELDRQARLPHAPEWDQSQTAESFARLTAAQQQTIVDDLLDGTLGELLRTQGRLMMAIVKLAYWCNFPEHRVRKSELGLGSGEVIFSDPEHLISNPNVPGTGTAWDYIGWHYPQRWGVERKNALAFLEANVPEHAAESEAALAELLEKDAARTLLFEP